MHRSLTGVIILLSTLAFTSGVVPAAESPTTGAMKGGIRYQIPPWFKDSFLDIPEDLAEAEASGRHVLLFLHLDECPYCAQMLRESFTESDFVDQIQAHFDCIAINVRGDREVALDAETAVSEKQLAELLKVSATPTLLFLDANSNPVLRINGYRSPRAMKTALDYVQNTAYRTSTLSEYAAALDRPPVYELRDDPLFLEVTDLSTLTERPVAVLFEDGDCDECDPFHDRQLKDPEIRATLAGFDLVQLDALSDQPIVDVNGNQTTPRAWAKSLALDYRPGLVLFDQGREIIRVDGMLNIFHLHQVLLFVADGEYQNYPSYRDYSRARRQALLEAGAVIDYAR